MFAESTSPWQVSAVPPPVICSDRLGANSGVVTAARSEVAARSMVSFSGARGQRLGLGLILGSFIGPHHPPDLDQI